MKAPLCLACAAFVLLAGCATPQPSSPAYLRVLAQKGVNPGTYTRISHGRVLTYDDVVDLVKKGVPGEKIVGYLKATRAPYRFTQKQINGLINAGADATLVNYLGRGLGDYMQDQGNIPRPTPAPGVDAPFIDPYFGDPYYMGPAPFFFGYPDDWMY